MTPEEVNKLNKKCKKQHTPKILKYCPNCNRSREVKYNEITCPVCKNNILQNEPPSYKSNYYTPPTTNDSQYQPKCPTCGSPNIRKISGLSRAAHGYVFGLFSKTARSQFECKNYGYKW